MALELATALTYSPPDSTDPKKRVTYEEGTPLTKLPSKMQKLAKELDLLRVHVAQPGEPSFDEIYEKARELGLVTMTAEELEASVKNLPAEEEVEEPEEEEEEEPQG